MIFIRKCIFFIIRLDFFDQEANGFKFLKRVFVASQHVFHILHNRRIVRHPPGHKQTKGTS